jgi:cation:H+ antiporter
VELVAILLLLVGLALVIGGAELFLAGLVASAERLRLSTFALTVLVSGLEVENIAAGIAANAKGLPGAAAGTFLGGATFLALGVTGIGALIRPLTAALPLAVTAWTALSPLPLVVLALDGELGRLDGALLVAWGVVALIGVARAGRSVGMEREPERSSLGRIAGPLALLGGLGVLTAGGEALGEGIRKAVERFQVSATLLGNTAIAAGVEAEEVARVAVPARRGRADVGLANIAGTLVHFLAFNAGIIALVKPLSLDSDSLDLHLPVAAVATLVFSAIVAVRAGVGRLAGATFVVLYCAYVTAAIIAA